MSAVSARLAVVRANPRLAGYYVTMSVVVAVFTALWLFEGYYLVTAWFPSLFDELTPINGVAAGAFMTLMLACSIAAAVRPTSAIGPAKVLLVGGGLLGALLPLSFAPTTPLVTAILLAIAASILVAIVQLHPDRDAVNPARAPALSYPLAGLAAVIAVPFLPLAADFQWLQLTLSDAAAERWLYGGLSMYLLAVVALAALASVDGRTRRFTAGSAVFLCGVLGLVSIAYPSELHSFGTVGGGLLLLWTVGVAVATALE